MHQQLLFHWRFPKRTPRGTSCSLVSPRRSGVHEQHVQTYLEDSAPDLMKIYLTLDYELFFGKSGSLQKCILEPTDRLTQICDKHQVRCVFFVDAGYLDKLRTLAGRAPELSRDRERVVDHIRQLSATGHDIQL